MFKFIIACLLAIFIFCFVCGVILLIKLLGFLATIFGAIVYFVFWLALAFFIIGTIVYILGGGMK